MRNTATLSVISAISLALAANAAILKVPLLQANSSSRRSERLAAHRAKKLSPDAAASGHTYGALWEVGNGYMSTLYIRNKNTQNQISASVVQYSASGGPLQQTPLHVPPGSVGRLQLGAGASAPPYNSIAWGGLMIEISGAPADETLGEVVVENYQTGVIFDLPVLGGYRYDRQEALYAPWWLPDSGTDGTLTLFNISGQSIMVSPSITKQGVEQGGEPFSLGPLQSQQMSLRSLMGELGVAEASEGFVTLRYTGPAHALDPALRLVNPSSGFSLTPAFNARLQNMGSGETNWQFPAVFAAGDSSLGFAPNQNLTAFALISNGTDAAVTPVVTAYAGQYANSPTAATALPIPPLAPLETRLINLSATLGSGLSGTSHFALSVGHGGSPGNLAVTVFSLGQNANFVLPSEGTVHPSTKVDSTYWDISDGLQAMLTMYNPGSGPVEAMATITYPTSEGVGTYALPAVALPPNASSALSLNELIASGTPDPSGHVIPPEVTFGTLTLQTGGAEGNVGLVVGGCSSFDPVRGGYGDTSEPDCELCDPDNEDDCETCEVDEDGDTTCVPDCSDPTCCPTSCAYPVNVHESPSSPTTNSAGDMIVVTLWGSSTGNLGDLSDVNIREVVTQPGGNPYNWPNPPWNVSAPNPEIVLGLNTGYLGKLTDPFHTGTFVKPYAAAQFTDSQVYQYQTPCSSEWITMYGPVDITRQVFQSNGVWTYSISRVTDSISFKLP